MRTVVMTFECEECENTIKHRVGVLTESDEIEIPWDFCEQTVFECDCGAKFYTGDFDYMSEDEV